MKYFGNKSLSSAMSVILHISWYIVLVLAIIAPVAISLVIFFSTPAGDITRASIAKGNFGVCGTKFADCGTMMAGNNSNDFTAKDKQDWENFKKLPLAVKILIFPYVEAVLILLLFLIKKSQNLFTNFKNDIVFNKNNVLIISKISKLNIGFSILTFSLSSLVVSIFLFMLCDIIKNGAVLQEEYDLTV